jgi:hypothetical protein
MANRLLAGRDASFIRKNWASKLSQATKLRDRPPNATEYYPLRRVRCLVFRRFFLPLRRIASVYQVISVARMKTIYPFALWPWEERVQLTAKDNEEKWTEAASAGWAVRIPTSSSASNGMVGIGRTIRIQVSCRWGSELPTSYMDRVRFKHLPASKRTSTLVHEMNDSR